MKETKMICMVAMDQERGIGKNNQLLVHLPKDLAFFKKVTQKYPLLMGTNTLKSLPFSLPLPYRKHLVLSFQVEKSLKEYQTIFENLSEEKKKIRQIPLFFSSKEDVLQYIHHGKDEKIFLSGGASIYQQFLEDCHALYVTELDACFDAEVFFPDFKKNPHFSLYKKSEMQTEGEINYHICLYLNKAKNLTEEEKQELASYF